MLNDTGSLDADLKIVIDKLVDFTGLMLSAHPVEILANTRTYFTKMLYETKQNKHFFAHFGC